MATSKTLTPTNQTIQIPAMADAPDASLIFNCLDKEADAINALNSQLTYQANSNIATQSAFDTVLDNALSSAPTNSEVHLRINPSASFGLFTNGEVYLVDMKKTASTTYSTAIISRAGGKNIINATRNTNGWSYDSITTSESITLTIPNTTSGTITARRGGTVINVRISSVTSSDPQGGWTTLATLPSGSRPPASVNMPLMYYGSGITPALIPGRVTDAGAIQAFGMGTREVTGSVAFVV